MNLREVINDCCQLCTGKDNKKPRDVFIAEASGMTWTVCPEHLMALVNAQKPSKKPKNERIPEAAPLFGDNGEEEDASVV
jgi:hypothetical protein